MLLKLKRLRAQAAVLSAGLLLAAATSAYSQSGQNSGSSSQSQQQSQDIPDAPSATQPPPAQTPHRLDKVPLPPAPSTETAPPEAQPGTAQPNAFPGSAPASGKGNATEPPPPMPPVRTVAPGSIPTQGSAGKEQLYKLVINTNFVQIPVTVKDDDGRLVDGLLPKDFSVLENGKPQPLSFFTSDPFELSVAILIDLGMSEAEVQKVNGTFPALIGAFSPYDEVAIYTYSSTVSQVSDFTPPNQRLNAVLNEIKTETGRNNGVPVLSGPLAPNGPIINGMPAGSGTEPVYTPPKEAHVLNDAILEAALDLSKRDKTRRKVIFVICDGREIGSKASYRGVLKVLLAQGIEVRGVEVGSGALPVYKQIERFHLPREGYGNLLPRYAAATGTSQVLSELSRNALEAAYADITSEARNQYTLGYTTRAAISTTCHSIEVRVDHPHLKIFAKDRYCPSASAR